MNLKTLIRALSGLLCAAFGLAFGELVAGITSTRSPIVSVGDRVVDGVPVRVKRIAIDLFGSNDKKALIAGIMTIIAVAALVLGIRASVSRRAGFAGVGLFVAVGSLFALTGRLGKFSDIIPIFCAGAATSMALAFLVLRPAKRERESAGATRRSGIVDHVVGETGRPLRAAQFDRRQFVAIGGGTAVAAVAAAALGRRLQGNHEATKVRSAATLPVAAAPLAPTPPGVEVGVPGVTPFFVPNRDFYRIDTALVVPRVDARTWSLTVDGMVDRPLTLTYDDLQKREIIEHDCTLMCVSNEIGGDLIGNARWLGVRLADVLREAGVKAGANQVFARSVDDFTAGFPTKLALDGREAMLAFGMNGEPLPFAHGYPVRLVVPGIYGYVSAVKWLKSITLTTFEAEQGYWIPRGWSALAPIKTGSRIDVPGRSSGQLHVGPQAIAGIAWAQHLGIRAVEVQVDDSPWQAADLATDGGIDTWRQWKLAWTATAGVHTIRVRATDITGATQSEQRTDVAPDGATGWHTIQVSIAP